MSQSLTKSSAGSMTKSQQPAATTKESLAVRVALNGNLAGLSDQQIWMFYQQMCERLELDPLSKPFDILESKEGDVVKKVLYPNSSCSSQLGVRHKVTYGPAKISPETELAAIGYKVARVSVECSLPDGRKLTGEAFIDLVGKFGPLAGKNLENALKKGATQARRRGTLQLCGLTMPDEDSGVSSLGEIEEEPEPAAFEYTPPAAELAPAPVEVSSPAVDATEEQLIDEALLNYCKQQKGEKNGPLFFKGMYGEKTVDQKRAIAQSLGLLSAPALEDLTVIEGEIEDNGQVISEIESLFGQLKALGKPSTEIDAQVARMASGLIALDEMDAETLRQVKGGLEFWRDQLKAEMSKGAAKQ